MMDKPHAHVLAVEDDAHLGAALRLALSDEGYSVEVAGDAATALEFMSASPPDLVLIDVMLPGVSGLELCRQIRQSGNVPIIMVTARDDSHDVVAGLEAGADDYVTKPFVFKELAARIRALLRRTKNTVPDLPTMTFGDLSIAPEGAVVSLRGKVLDLTRIEFLVLCELASNPRRVLSREQLLNNVWGYDYFGDGRVVDAHIARLRKKLEGNPGGPSYIATVRGLGYRFTPPE